MKERKYVKFRVDMFEDTKFKIIDMMPERDTIYYVWTRVVALAGKVNREGDLYLSKNIPYTIETLAIEFNRDVSQIKLAFDVFVELEMIELTKDKIYRVKNFAKHQNIKVNEKNKSNDKEDNINKTDVRINENLLTEISMNTDKESDNKMNKEEVNNVEGNDNENLEIIQKDLSNMDDNIKDEKINDNLQDYVSIPLDTKKARKINKKNKIDKVQEICVMDEELDDNSKCCFTDGVRTLCDGESTVFELSFG